jgi:hypothetical protein
MYYLPLIDFWYGYRIRYKIVYYKIYTPHLFKFLTIFKLNEW